MRHLALALVLTTSLLAAGCGGDSGGGGGGGPVGTYVMDAEAMKPEIEKMLGPMMEAAKKMVDMLPPEQRAEAQKKMEAQKAEAMEQFDFSVTLNEDGSFVVTEKDGVKARGTWKLDGTTLHVTTTEENGKPKENPETLQGTLDGGTIRFKPDKDMPFDLVFKKE